MGIFNCAETLSVAIDSILKQTYSNWELVMCDDGSTDGTYEIAQQYKKIYPDRIILLRNEENRRLSYTLNRCLEAANGELIARMDGDDISLPERLEQQVAWLKAHPDMDLVGTAMCWFCEQDGLMATINPARDPDYYTLRRRTPFFHATIMTYKSVLDELGGYTVSERTKRSQDYDLWFRFYYAGYQGNNIQKALYLAREDSSAIRRRTISVRWNRFRTARLGFRLLGYPRYWIIRPLIEVLWKTVIPFCLVQYYRALQAKVARIHGIGLMDTDFKKLAGMGEQSD